MAVLASLRHPIVLGIFMSLGWQWTPAWATDEQADPPNQAEMAQKSAQSKGRLTVSVEPSQTEVKLGEPLTLKVTIAGPQATEYGFAPTMDLGAFVELSRQERPTSEQDKKTIVLKVACYRKLGAIEISGMAMSKPALDGGTSEPIQVGPIQITVTSVLDGVEKPNPKDVAQPVTVYVDDFRPLVLAGLVCVWILLVLLLRRKPSEEETQITLESLPPPRLAHEIALEKLNALIDDDLLKKGEFHLFFQRLSEATREYLGNRYGFFALDLTSFELVQELRDRRTPGLDLDSLRTLLSDADLVKFAKLVPTDAMCSSAIDQAFSLIEATKLVELTQDKVVAS